MNDYGLLGGDLSHEDAYQRHKRYRENIYDLMSKCDWQWFATMNVGRYDVSRVNDLLRSYIRQLGVTEGIQVGAQGVINSMPHPHVHLLMVSDSSRGRTLINTDSDVWEHNWFKRTHRGCQIEEVYDLEGVVGYVFFHNTPAEGFELVNPYNLKLLEKMAAIKKDSSLVVRKRRFDPFQRNKYQSWGKIQPIKRN